MRATLTLLVLLVLTCMSGAVFGQTSPATSPSSATQTADSANPPVIAGKVELLEGDVRIFDNQKKRRTVQVGDTVYEGDSVVTGADGEIHMTMSDEGFIAVRPNTKLRIALYRANGDAQDQGIIGLLSGSLRSITGWIGKYKPKAYVIRTPNATIGIRGTDHEPKVIPEGSSEGDPGTYDKVNIGGTTMHTPQGNVDVVPNRAAYAPRPGTPGAAAGPRLLDHIPGFFRPTRNEHLIEGKHAQVQRTLEQKRNERRQQVQNNLQGKGPAGHAQNAVNTRNRAENTAANKTGDKAGSTAGNKAAPENAANKGKAQNKRRKPKQAPDERR
ncbi:MAG: FecR domain-containing protein [Burkholderiaceae bacterium]|nr:FecR domain-containing protein [Burkholderiaceae bacterium]